MNWYLEVLKKFTDFNGRARRKEYWYFVLVNCIIATILYFTGKMFYNIYVFAVFVPSIAVGIRRLHDIDKSGWYVLLSFVPIVNIWFLILMCTDGTYGSNKYGDSPKQIGY